MDSEPLSSPGNSPPNSQCPVGFNIFGNMVIPHVPMSTGLMISIMLSPSLGNDSTPSAFLRFYNVFPLTVPPIRNKVFIEFRDFEFSDILID